MADYSQIAKEARIKVLSMIYSAQTSHIGSCLSVIDILTVLFEKKTKDDIVILSAGWKAAAFYYFLARDGKFPMEDLDTYCMPGSQYIGLTEPMPGVLFAGGSMGMGLPASVGFALAKKLKGEKGTVYVIMSDGELQCGTTWEALLIAEQNKLNNLCIFVDVNGLQAMGNTNDILVTNFEAFKGIGVRVSRINGHSYDEILFSILWENGFDENHSSIIFANTIKGKGVSFMENNNDWHYKNIDERLYQLALKELT